MTESERDQIDRGITGPFHWLLAYDRCLGDILEACPEVVIGKHIAITAFDSGPIRELTEEEQRSGWTLRDEIAYSPCIAAIEDLDPFYDNSFDEWYIFKSPADIGKRVDEGINIFSTPPDIREVVPLVNYFLTLGSPEHAVEALFWRQMDWIKPDIYVSDNQSWLTIVSADGALVESVNRKFASNS